MIYLYLSDIISGLNLLLIILISLLIIKLVFKVPSFKKEPSYNRLLITLILCIIIGILLPSKSTLRGLAVIDNPELFQYPILEPYSIDN